MNQGIKRLLDILFASIAAIVLFPILLLIAFITKISSKGNIIYQQERIGLNGKKFIIYKFRSMYSHAEINGPELSYKNDPRITTWGKFMRRWKMDELPQLWNIIKGDMSLVGPRPERKYYIQQIIHQSPEYNILLQTKPGLTSMGMIKFGYASSVEEMIARMQYDLEYLNQSSLLTDSKIIFKSLQLVISGKM